MHTLRPDLARNQRMSLETCITVPMHQKWCASHTARQRACLVWNLRQVKCNLCCYTAARSDVQLAHKPGDLHHHAHAPEGDHWCTPACSVSGLRFDWARNMLPCSLPCSLSCLMPDAEDLVRKKIRDHTDFEWLKQCRFYWREDRQTVVISICDVDFDYSFEYLGATQQPPAAVADMPHCSVHVHVHVQDPQLQAENRHLCSVALCNADLSAVWQRLLS